MFSINEEVGPNHERPVFYPYFTKMEINQVSDKSDQGYTMISVELKVEPFFSLLFNNAKLTNL
jgi:hypothetical protein